LQEREGGKQKTAARPLARRAVIAAHREYGTSTSGFSTHDSRSEDFRPRTEDARFERRDARIHTLHHTRRVAGPSGNVFDAERTMLRPGCATLSAFCAAELALGYGWTTASRFRMNSRLVRHTACRQPAGGRA
jgi:hypothetical protein